MTDGGYTVTEGWNLQIQAQVDALRKEKAEAKRLVEQRHGHKGTASILRWALKLAGDRIADLEAALKPFADEADNYDDADDPDSRKIDDLGVADVTVGHCRTARRVLKDNE